MADADETVKQTHNATIVPHETGDLTTSYVAKIVAEMHNCDTCSVYVYNEDGSNAISWKLLGCNLKEPPAYGTTAGAWALLEDADGESEFITDTESSTIKVFHVPCHNITLIARGAGTITDKAHFDIMKTRRRG